MAPGVCAQLPTDSVPPSSSGITGGPVVSDVRQPIRAAAAFHQSWRTSDGIVHALKGGYGGGPFVELRQGDLRLISENMVLIETSTPAGTDLQVYAEHRAILDHQGRTPAAAARTLLLQSPEPVAVAADTQVQESAGIPDDSLVQRAFLRFRVGDQADDEITGVSLQTEPRRFIPPPVSRDGASASFGNRRVRVRPRSGRPLHYEFFTSEDTVPEEQVHVITGGVNVVVEGMALDVSGHTMTPGVIDLSADSIVIWTQSSEENSLEAGSVLVQPGDSKFQVYMEGNIVVRQHDNRITATHAFMDANTDRALLMNAELRATVPETGGVFRVRAERLRQLAANRFHGRNAWTSTSPYGKPGYRIQASDVIVEPGAQTPWAGVDPVTGRIRTDTPLWVTAENARFIVGDTPLFMLPRISGPIEDPNIPIRRAAVRQDSVFGAQVTTVWNLSKLLGAGKIPGMQWDLLADYRSERGPGIGIGSTYSMQGPGGRTDGRGRIYFQHDDGADNLGRDRRRLTPESRQRGEAVWRHRVETPDGTLLFGEIGYLSDRNYLEQYDEARFDTDKDAETVLGIRRDSEAFSGMLWGKAELNDFETSTQWLPRADLFSFSEPLGGGLAYWSSHSSVGYADMQVGDAPSDPLDPWTPFGNPYVGNLSGVVAMTRHRIDAPFMVGPISVTPFAMGEAAYWEEGLAGDSVDRLLINGGVRASLQASRVMPFVRSDLFHLNGLAHKHETIVEYSVTDVSEDLSGIAQYNEIDENAQERFRNRYTSSVFPGLIPGELDPRNFAVRYGAGLWTSAPWHELVNRQQVVRLRFRNRLQTHVGPADNLRVRDWMIAETGISWFPNADRDNFGEEFGLLYGNYRWNVSDRTSILADGQWDFFDHGQNVWSAGILSQRSTRGSVYVAYRQVRADPFIDSRILTGSYSYQMNDKWISTASFAYDLGESEARGTSLTVSRVGLDWILHLGVGVDVSKDNVGFAFALEPRFGPANPTNMSYLLGLGR